PPFQHPFRLTFFGRDIADSVFVQPLGREILFNVAGPAKFIFGRFISGSDGFGVADSHVAVLVSHAVSPARLSSDTPASAPRIAPFTAPQCGRTRQLSSSAHSWRVSSIQAVMAMGPSTASTISARLISFAGRASAKPPPVPRADSS